MFLKGNIVQFVFLLSVLTANLIAENNSRASELLRKYLEKDLSLKKYTILVEQAELSLDKAYINNGIDITLASGTMTFKTSDNGNVFTVNPSASIEIPQLNGTTLEASGTFSSSESSDTWKDLSFLLMTDIFTSTRLNREISILKAKRELTEAKRNLRKQALQAESEFYESLKELFDFLADVYEAKNDLYEKELNLKTVQSQGYSRTSSTYRSAQLEVDSYSRDVEKAIRELNRNTVLFASLCGEKFEVESVDEGEKKALDFLPMEIEAVKALDIKDFDVESFEEVENATWTHYIEALERKADTHFSLRAGAGYTFNNSDADSDTIDGKIALEWGALTANAGVALPTGDKILDSKTPASENSDLVYTLSMTLKPNTFRLNKISDEIAKLDNDIEEIELKSAYESYSTSVIDKNLDLEDIEWSKKSYEEQYSMYSELEKDSKKHWKAGIITESDYLDAKTKRDLAKINSIIADIDMIIHNNSVNLLFVQD